MNTEPNLEEYPKLTPPDVVYEHKASLKKTVVIPLYAKIVAAAAAVVLLFGVFWLRSGLPEQELVAELNAVKVDVLRRKNLILWQKVKRGLSFLRRLSILQ